RRSEAEGAVDGAAAAVHLDDLPRDGQAEARADDLAGVFVLVSLVAPEQPVDELGRNAAAMVADDHFDRPSAQARAGADLSAVGGVLDRVAEEVGKNLEQAVRVTYYIGQARLELRDHGVLVRGYGCPLDRVLDELVHVE